jgi:hypothetical protein
MRIVTTPIQRKRTLDHSALNTRPRKRSAQTLHAPSGVIFAELYTPAKMENVELRQGIGTHGRINGQTLHSGKSTKPSPSSPSLSTSAASRPSIVASSPTADLFAFTSSIPAVSLPPPLFQPNPSPQPTAHNSLPDKMQQDLEEITAFVKMKGFTSISHVHQTLHEYPYEESSVLRQEQRDDWVDGMPQLLRAIQVSKKRQEPCVRKVFHDSILSYAADLLKVELDAFLLHKDNRTQTNNIRNKAPSTPAFLRMPAADITPKFLESNVLGECEKVFSGSHDNWEGVSSVVPATDLVS